jgi:acetylornithine deacetylase/succinyl-diaminopimelate desuccinylase family protein
MVKDQIKAIIEKNFKEQASFLQKLVQTKSANPFTPDQSDPKAPIELEVAKVIEKKLKSFGFKPQRVALYPQKRPNLVVRIKGQKGAKSLIFNGHMDTIIPASDYTFAPYSGMIKNGKLYGVGAADMKASLSCFVFLAKALQALKIKLLGDLILTFVIDEEPGASSPYGTAYLLQKGLKAEAAIIAEPRTDKIVIGCRGGYRFKITTFGEAAHTGMKEWEKGTKGRNAIQAMATIITQLRSLPISYQPSALFPGVQPVFTFPTKISGGTAINIVPERCEAYGDTRILPSHHPQQIRELILEKLKPLRGKIKFELEDLAKVPATKISPQEEIVQVLKKAAKEVLAKKPKIGGARPWDDSWMLIKKGIPTIAGFGPDGAGIHGQDEYVELKSVKQITEVFTRTAIEFLGKA